jgi:polyferredoxin
MGTVKDAVVLYGATGAIFKPRMIAMAVLLMTVVLANKFICAWGCQLGVLQDLLLRIRTDVVRVGAPYKPPFAVTNAIRVSFFALIVIFAFLLGFDIVEPIDPFKVYKPAALTVYGAVFLVAILGASLVVYRPWCHLFCPFGLLGWVAEKISVFKIKVDYDACIACGACEKACPSTVMEAILRRDRVIPDCFACATCVETCPVDAVHLRAGRRSLPPSGKFDGRGAGSRRKASRLPDEASEPVE